ncbi:MAG: DUF1173 family protein [Nocardioidaceae bacterium]
MTHQPHSWLVAGRRITDPGDRAAQQLLALAHDKQTRPLCECVRAGVETYVARTPTGRFIIKRLPNSGPRHHHDCESYEPPQALSGRGEIATDVNADGATVLRLGFRLHRNPDRPRADSSGQLGGTSRHSSPPSRAVSLEALLHYLWDEAGFTRWSPKMAGKRNWSLIRYHLTRVAEQTMIGGRSLAELLWIPEPFDRRDLAQIEARRQAAWEPLATTSSTYRDQRPFGLAVLEWAGIKPARYGQAIAVKQMARPPFMVGDELLANLGERFPQIELHARTPGHLVMAATFSLSRGGYPVVEDAAFLCTDVNWLPHSTTAEVDLLIAAVDQQRRFTTPLRYGMTSGIPTPSLVLTDTPEPVAAYIAGDRHSADLAEHAAAAAGTPAWVWCTTHPRPDLPTPRLSPGS